MKKFQVATYDQHLTCNGRDLNDNQATLASLRIFPGTVIILQVNKIFFAIPVRTYVFSTSWIRFTSGWKQVGSIK